MSTLIVPAFQASPPTPKKLRERLREHFGFRSFRPGQAEAVALALEGHDTLVLMPTGSGKSLCFQLPALELPGLTVVVSPLIALMKDQADHLAERGIGVAVLNSSRPAAEQREAEAAIAGGRVKFVYTTPERLDSPDFRALLKQQQIDLFIVDEAHCVSGWGYDFRPEYLMLSAAIDELGRPPVLALTATATPDVIADILSLLHIPHAEVVHTGFYRPNIDLEVIPITDDADNQKLARLVAMLSRVEGSAIVYAATVAAVEEVAGLLAGHGLAAGAYHGRLPARRRTEAQNRFMAGDLRVMVATNAFGLGIDKPDIRFVIHYHVPGTLEALYQELGRAGRDGASARATLLYNPEDLKLQRFFQGGRYPDESDLVNAYHTLTLLADRPKPPTFGEILAISPVPRTRLKVCLTLFANLAIVRREGGRYRLLRPDLARDDLAREGKAYRERQERDQLRQRQIADYVEGSACRWQMLLHAFGGESLPGDHCGHCDCCAPARFG